MPSFLASFLIRSAMLLVGGFAASALLRRSSAVLRHRLWALLLAAALLLPLGMTVLPSVSLPWPRTPISAALAAAVVPPVPIARSATPRAATAAPGAPAPTTAPPSWPLAAALLWLVGVAVGLGRLARSWLGFCRLAWAAAPAPQSLEQTCRTTAVQLGLRRTLRCALLDGNAMPQAGGILAPVVLLPATAVAWPAPRLALVLRHELAHLRRGDCAWTLVARLAQSVLWPNPLVHIAARRLRLAAEQASDDLAMATPGADPREYARQLVEIARSLLDAQPAAAPALGIITQGDARRSRAGARAHDGSSQLGRRVAALLDPQRARRPRRGALLALAAPIAALALLAAAAQQAPAELPSFAAASIKPVETGPGEHVDEHGDPVHMDFMANLHQFIVESYGIMPKQLGGEPAWFQDKHFDIQAVCAKTCGDEERMLMLRRLLQERFHLALREEQRDQPVYLLEIAPGGVKFHALAPGQQASDPSRAAGHYARSFETMDILLANLNHKYGGPLRVDRPVLDRTGLTGNYNMVLDTSMVRGNGQVEFPDLFSDLPQQLGLKLVPARAPMSYFTVVSASLPTPN